MPRPRKQTVDWFPHYVSAGKTKFVLRSRFGMAGLGAWWSMLELLCRTPGHAYSCIKSLEWQFLVAEMGLSEVETEDFMKCLVDLEAIDADLWSQKTIWCQHLVDEIGDAYKNRSSELPVKPGDNAVSTGRNSIKPPDNPQTTRDDNRRQDTTLQKTTEDESSLSSIDQKEVLEIANKENIPIPKGELTKVCEKYSSEWVKEAINEAVSANKREWRYVVGVLKICLEEGHAPGQKRSQPSNPNEKFKHGKFSHLVKT